MAQRLELGAHRFRHALLDQQHVRLGERDTPCVDGGLHVHLEVDQVDGELRDRLRDGVPAGRPDRGPGTAVPHDDGGALRRVLAVAGGGVHRVALGLIGGIGHRVVQPDAGVLDEHRAAKAVTERDRCRDDVAPAVSDDEVRRVGPLGGRRPRRLEPAGAGGVQCVSLLLPVRLGQQHIEGRRVHLGATGILQPGPEGVLGGFGEPMQIRGCVRPERGGVVPGHYSGGHQRRERVRRCARRHHFVAAIVDRDRLEPLRLVLDEILHRQEPVPALDLGDDRLAKGAAIERRGALGRDRPHRGCQLVLPQPVPLAQRLAARPVDRLRAIREVLPGAGDRPAERRGHPNTFVGVKDRGLPEIGPRQAAVLLPQRLEPMQVPWRRDRLGGSHHVLEPLGLAKYIGVGGLRESAVVVQIAGLVPLRVVEDHGAIAAEDVRVHRLDDGQRRRDRHRGVEGVPAQLENLDPRLGGPSMRRGDHPAGAGRTVRAHDRRVDCLGRLGRGLDDVLGAAEHAETGEHDRNEQHERLSGLHGCLTSTSLSGRLLRESHAVIARVTRDQDPYTRIRD